MTCLHENLLTTAKVCRFESARDPQMRMVDVDIRCKDCGAIARWLGVPMGVSLSNPMTGVLREELRAPVRFETEAEATASFRAAAGLTAGDA